jgi:hypothetical protein
VEPAETIEDSFLLNTCVASKGSQRDVHATRFFRFLLFLFLIGAALRASTQPSIHFHLPLITYHFPVTLGC